MDTANQPLPHLALRAAKKLNPKLQCWRWNEGFTCNFTYEPGCWVPVGTPKWLPHCIYAVTGSKKEKPSQLNRTASSQHHDDEAADGTDQPQPAVSSLYGG